MKQCCLCGKSGHESISCQWVKNAKRAMMNHALRLGFVIPLYADKTCHQSNQS